MVLKLIARTAHATLATPNASHNRRQRVAQEDRRSFGFATSGQFSHRCTLATWARRPYGVVALWRFRPRELQGWAIERIRALVLEASTQRYGPGLVHNQRVHKIGCLRAVRGFHG